jgi:hypothetical protein
VADSPLPDCWKVADAVVGDFDGDGRFDLFLGGFLETTEVAMESPSSLFVAFEVSNGERRVSFRSAASSLKVRASGFGVTPATLHLGEEGRQPKARTFMLTQRPDHAGVVPPEQREERGLYFGFDPAAGSWEIVAQTAEWWGPFLAIEGDAPIEDVAVEGVRHHDPATPPRLLRQDEESRFVDVTASAGLAWPLAVRSAVGGDFDCDGDLDLFVVQGRRAGDLPDVLLLNDGSGRFAPVLDAAGAAGDGAGSGDVAVTLDCDGDGFLDLFVVNGEGPGPHAPQGRNRLFRNLGTGRHWIAFDLVGSVSNRDGIGAVVELRAGGRTQVRLNGGGMHRYAQDSRRVHFGLGDASRVDEVLVRWPSGLVSRITDVPFDRVSTINEAPGALLRQGG